MLSPLFHADAALRAWLAAPHSSTLDTAMAVASAIGRRGAIWLAIGVLLTVARRIRLQSLWQLIIATAVVWVLNDGLVKPLVARPRPFVSAPAIVRVVGAPPSGASFPSGHAAAAVVGAFLLAAYWPDGRIVCWLLAILIMYSRVYVGAHYPLDVVGGALLGWLVAWVAIGGHDGIAVTTAAPPRDGRGSAPRHLML
jgi:undecaprenyl-diphosphatase